MRRSLVLASSLGLAVLCAYSCSLRASVTTDGNGHVVGVHAVRIQSTLERIAVGLWVDAAGLGLDLRMGRDAALRWHEAARVALSGEWRP